MAGHRALDHGAYSEISQASALFAGSEDRQHLPGDSGTDSTGHLQPGKTGTAAKDQLETGCSARPDPDGIQDAAPQRKPV